MKRLFIPIVTALTLTLLSGCEKIVNEYQYVDLGLSVKWAKVNVGAVRTMEYGDYFAWGEVSPKDSCSEDNYKWYDEKGKITKYCSDESYDNPDFLVTLKKDDDVATVMWGKDWRMPTNDEMLELMQECTWTWSSIDGVKGFKVSSNVPGYTDRYIFLPAAGLKMDSDEYPGFEGYYWTASNCGLNKSMWSDCLIFKSENIYSDGIIRSVGAAIRPVHE